jgi:hypothetical protein
MVSVTTPATNNSGDKAEAPVVSSGGNDPDGVGEGWRVLRHGELTQPGDVYKNHNGILCEFGPTGWPVGYQTIYRRRIATPVIVAGGTPDDPYNKKLLDSIQGSNEALESDPDWRPDGVDHKSVLGKKMNEAIEKAKEHMEGKEPNLNRYAEHRASEPQGKQDEWWLDTSWGSDRLYAYDCKTTNGIHVRRVNDAMDEWTAKLIELCHEACECGDEDDEHDCIIAVDAHMKARPQ